MIVQAALTYATGNKYRNYLTLLVFNQGSLSKDCIGHSSLAAKGCDPEFVEGAGPVRPNRTVSVQASRRSNVRSRAPDTLFVPAPALRDATQTCNVATQGRRNAGQHKAALEGVAMAGAGGGSADIGHVGCRAFCCSLPVLGHKPGNKGRIPV